MKKQLSNFSIIHLLLVGERPVDKSFFTNDVPIVSQDVKMTFFTIFTRQNVTTCFLTAPGCMHDERFLVFLVATFNQVFLYHTLWR